MSSDQAALVLEQDQDDYHRHLAAEIVAMMPPIRSEAWAVLRLAIAILDLRPDPEPERPKIGGDLQT